MKGVIFLARRLVRLLVTVFLISTIVFVVIRVVPGDPAHVIAGIDASEEDISAIRESIGTNTGLGQQYFEWLWSVIRFDFGKSLISGRPVTELIWERFPLTLSIALLGMTISIFFAVPLGVLSAVRRGSVWDYGGIIFSQVGIAVPSFWLGILLLLVFAVKMQIFPLFGAGGFRHLVLPALSLGIARAAVLLRMTRASMIEELNKEYVVAARAKGLTENMVKYKHTLRNAILPLMTVAGIQLGYMLGGTIIIEQVFSLPGLGRLFLSGVYQRDFPVVQGGVVFIAVVFSLINTVVDFFYGIVNPKIRVR